MMDKLYMKWWFWLFVCFLALIGTIGASWITTAVKGEYVIRFETDDNSRAVYTAVYDLDHQCEPTPTDVNKPETRFGCFYMDTRTNDSKTNCDYFNSMDSEWGWKEYNLTEAD